MRRGRLVGAVAVVAGVGLTVGVLVTVLGGGSGPGAEPGAFTPRVPRMLPAPNAPEVEWATPVRGEPMAVTAAGADVVATALGEVRLLDGASGSTRWRTNVDGVRRARPAVSATAVAVTTDTEVVILDRATGRVRARARIDGPAAPAIAPSSVPVTATATATAGGELVIVTSESGAIVAVDATTGELRWSAQYGGSVPMAPVVDRGVVVAAWHSPTSTVVRVFDAGTGLERWRREVGARSGAPLAAAGMVLVQAGSGVTDARAQAFDLLTGAERWSTAVPGYSERLVRPASDGTTAYLLDGVGTVTALDLRTGAVRWQQATGASVIDSPLVLAGSSVLFPSFSDALVALDRTTGALRSADVQPGVPIDVTTTPSAPATSAPGTAGHLVLALRLAAPSRVEARPVP